MKNDYSVPNSQHRNSSRKAQTISKKVKTASDALHKLSYTIFKQDNWTQSTDKGS